MRILGGALALLLAAGSPTWAGLPDAGWNAALAVPLPLPVIPPPAAVVPPFAALQPVPSVSFNGISLKGVQFSRSDRIPQSLVAAIDRTQRTLIVAIYELTLPDVAAALVRAKGRGVDVRVIYDMGHATGSTPASPDYQSVVSAGVPVRLLKGGGSFGIMHNKFAVFDGALLETGSFNWTSAADGKNFENALFRTEQGIIDGYAKYWDWMWGLATPASAAGGAAAGAGLGTPPGDPLRPVTFAGGSYPRFAFSPEGGIEDLLVDALGRARSTIDMAIFSLYSQRVADALIAAKARGVSVRVVSDASQSKRSAPVLSVVSAGVPLRLSAGRDGATGVLHHKFVVIDGAFLMTGSYNFSQNAELYNFENDLFTTAPGEVFAYTGELSAVWAQAHAPAPSELPAPKSL